MKILTSLISIYFDPAIANHFVATAEIRPSEQATIAHQLNSSGTTFLNTDPISLSFDLQIAKEDIGIKSANYLLDSKNNW